MTVRRREPPDLLSRQEASEQFGVEQRTLRAWEDEGRLPVVRLLTGHRRYRREDVARLVGDAGVVEEPVAPAPPPQRPKPQPPTRAAARRRALEALHAGDVAGSDPRDLLDPDAPAYASEILEGIAMHAGAIDAAIHTVSTRWTLERMPVVDRNILRIAVYELLHTDIPTGVIIDQAVTLARLLSTEESGRFVHGVVGTLAANHR